MIREEVAIRQLVRMTGLINFPTTNEGQEEVIKALMRFALSDGHAARMVDRWLIKSRYCMTPMDVAETADMTAPYEPSTISNRRCKYCDGVGWVQVWQLQTNERLPNGSQYTSKQTITDQATADELKRKVDGKLQRVYDCVVRCGHCAFGRELEQPDTSEVSIP